MSDGRREDRREFLISLGRKALLGAMLLGTGALVSRPQKSNETCEGDGICSNCGQLPACGLPQALSARRERGHGSWVMGRDHPMTHDP